MKNYKKLYKQEVEKNAELKSQIYELQVVAKEAEPYCIIVSFDEKGENVAYLENVIEHKVGYKPYPDGRPENWKITTSGGLTSVFDYDKVVYVLAYRNNGRSVIIEQITQNLSDTLKGCNK